MKAGFKEIIIVINQYKNIIPQYLSTRSSIFRNINIKYIYQDDQLGIADAILCAESLLKNQNFGVIYPDNPALYQQPPIASLIKTLDQNGQDNCIVGFAKYPSNIDMPYGECLVTKKGGKLLHYVHACPRFEEKEKFHHQNPTFIAGRFIYPKTTLSHIKQLLKQNKIKEPGDIHILDLMLGSGENILGVLVNSYICDTGTPRGYAVANKKFIESPNL